MRRAIQNVNVFCDDGNALLSFGYDYCAEHEWGIAGIHRSFGVSNDMNDLTIGRYAVTTPGPLLIVEPPKPRGKEKRLYLLGGGFDLWTQTPEEFVTGYRDSGPQDGKPESHWDESAFMFSVPVTFGKIKTFRAVYEALQAKDALIYRYGSSNPFAGSGLVIVRRSTIAPEHVASMEASFRDTAALQAAAAATGIKDRVEAWGRQRERFGGAFYALSPSWLKKGFVTKDGPRTSAHPVIFWLNPCDQKNNNYGWFTVEELELWMEGKGPIPIKQNAVA